jgi:hypothetical protein
VVARCKRCQGKLVIEPAERPATDIRSEPGTTAKPLGAEPEQRSGTADATQGACIDPLMDLTAFIGPKAEKYLDIFKGFEDDGRTRFRLTWHWPAALVGFWWLLYRKLYGWAVVALVLALVPVANLLAIVGFGLGANYLYYRHAQKKIGTIRTALPDANLFITLRQLGGVNRWAMVVAIVLGGIGLAGMLASVVLEKV